MADHGPTSSDLVLDDHDDASRRPPDEAPAEAPAAGAAPSAPLDRGVRLLLGLVTGGLTLIGMVRLVGGVFEGQLAVFAWVVVALTMVPWVAYCGSRARHGRLSRRWGLTIAVLVAVGAVAVWWSSLGAVIALVCSLVAFALIWVSDWPGRRSSRAERFVRIEELGRPDDEDDDHETGPASAEPAQDELVSCQADSLPKSLR